MPASGDLFSRSPDQCAIDPALPVEADAKKAFFQDITEQVFSLR